MRLDQIKAEAEAVLSRHIRDEGHGCRTSPCSRCKDTKRILALVEVAEATDSFLRAPIGSRVRDELERALCAALAKLEELK
jgi:hypothetical protein